VNFFPEILNSVGEQVKINPANFWVALPNESSGTRLKPDKTLWFIFQESFLRFLFFFNFMFVW